MKLFLKVIILFFSASLQHLQNAIDFSFKSIDGGSLDIKAYEGKAVLVTKQLRDADLQTNIQI